ncbi:hypothetical protein HK102_004632, partial [Quaeritorhiza haematococci]
MLAAKRNHNSKGRSRTVSTDHSLAVPKTSRHSINKYSPLQSVYCGIELEPTGMDYYIGSVCPNKVAPVTAVTDEPIRRVRKESSASWDYYEDETSLTELMITQIEDSIIDWLRDYQEKHACKFQIAGIGVEEGDQLVQEGGAPLYIRRRRVVGRFHLPARLWSELDIIPFVMNVHGASIDERACSAVRKALFYVTPHTLGNIPRISVGYRHQVEVDCDFQVHISDLDDFGATVSKATWHLVKTLAEKVADRRLQVMFVNSTPQGGGVALMRHATIRFLHLLGVSARWFVMKPKPEAFVITKRKFHNVLQGVAPPGTRLTSDDVEEYENWCRDNAERYWMAGPFAQVDVVVIDDPQPCGMIKYIKEVNPKCKIIYRSHIE